MIGVDLLEIGSVKLMPNSRKIKVHITQMNVTHPRPVYYAGNWTPDRYTSRHHTPSKVTFSGSIDWSDFDRLNELTDMYRRTHGELYLTDDKPAKVIPPKKPKASMLRFLN